MQQVIEYEEHLKRSANPLQASLEKIRKDLLYRSARGFFDQYLSVRTRLDFNYSYYMKIEGGKIIPSAQVISNLCSALEENDARKIMLSYCETIFPERAVVFRKLEKNAQVVKNLPTKESVTLSASNQNFLNLAQVAAVSESKAHYFVFLVLTLARHPIELEMVRAALKSSLPPGMNLNGIVRNLQKAKLIRDDNGKLQSISTDMRFPAAETDSQKKLYEQMDTWSIAFNAETGFQPLLQKMMVRRVSLRYLNLIQAHCNVLLDLVRAADEISPVHNDEVLMLNLSIQHGRLPG